MTDIADLVESFRRLDLKINRAGDAELIEIIRKAHPQMPEGSIAGHLETLRRQGARAMYRSSFVDQFVARRLTEWAENNIDLEGLSPGSLGERNG